MLPDLEIKILFCYSPEILANTYNDLNQLQEDNLQLCFITQDVFKRNIINYNVKVSLVSTIEIDNLQTQYGINFHCLNINQLNDLVGCTTQQAMANNDPNKFGFLPTHILRLKNASNATVVVLQVLLCGKPNIIGAVSSYIGIKEGRDCIIAIFKGFQTQGVKVSSALPTLLAHEAGHLMGCRHPFGTGRGFDLTPAMSHGHCIQDLSSGRVLCGTIMSYADHIVPYYSNPNLFAYPAPYQNIPCGVVGVSEAWITVNNNIQKLAGIF